MIKHLQEKTISNNRTTKHQTKNNIEHPLYFFRIIVFALALFTLSQTDSYSQTGSIKGIIFDKDTSNKESLVGANIAVQGANLGAASDLDGNFEISNVPIGYQTIIISYVGYKSEKVTVKINDKETTTLKIALENEGKLQEVEVVGTRVTQTEKAVIKEMKTSTSVLSGISREQISKGQDRDAAEVVRRVSGVTLIDDRLIVVRGIPERYNSVWINEASTPSYEQESKIFSFDNIPSSVIDRIVLYKSPAPELSGEFSGGFVKIHTLGIPSENNLKLGISTSYRPGSTFKETKLATKGSLDHLGFNDGTYRLNPDVPLDGLAQSGQKYDWIKVGQLFNNNWIPETSNTPMDMRANLLWNRRINLGNNILLGNSTIINYSNTSLQFEAIRQHLNPYGGVRTTKAEPVFSLTQDLNNRTTRLGIMESIGIQLGSKHTVQFKNLFTQQGVRQYWTMTGTENTVYSGTYIRNTTIWNNYRSVFSSQLIGNHKIGNNTQIDWVIAYSKAQREDPDIKRYTERLNNLIEKEANLIMGATVSAFYFGRIFFRTNEDLKTSRIDLNHTITFLPFLNFKPEFKTGLFLEERKRQFKMRLFAYDDNWGNPSGGFYNDINIEDFTTNELNNPSTWNDFNGLVMREVQTASTSYNGTNRLLAYYAALNLPLLPSFNIYSGVRIEKNILSVVDTSNILSILPSVNMTYKFSDKTQVRASYGKTVNRPEFREFSSLSYFDFIQNKNVIGNPRLKVANIHNFDARLEYYPKSGEHLNIGYFYKRFINPIELVFDPFSADFAINFANANSAYSHGMEIEIARKLSNLLFLPEARILKNFQLIANASIVRSNVDLTNTINAVKRPLMGQSPYTINTALSYNHEPSKLIVNLSYNIIGKRLFLADFVGNTNPTGNIFEMSRNVIDLTITKRIKKHLEIKAGVQDLINQNILFIQDANLDGEVRRNGRNQDLLPNRFVGQEEQIDGVFWSYRLGSYYTFNISYNF